MGSWFDPKTNNRESLPNSENTLFDVWPSGLELPVQPLPDRTATGAK